MVVPTLVTQALSGKPITVFGDGTQSRCFTHVSDIVETLMMIPEAPQTHGQVINLGNDQEITILGLAERIKELTGSPSPIKIIPYDQAYGPGFEDMHRRVPDLSKAARLLGYRPTRSLDDILHDVIQDKRARISLG